MKLNRKEFIKATVIVAVAITTGCRSVYKTDPRWVYLAAGDSRAEAKGAADFVCDGTNDEATVQCAIDECKASGRQLFCYYPQYMQQVFDTDLNKLLICTDPAKRRWVDALGNPTE